jgi:ABC-2 type transport system permease protein
MLLTVPFMLLSVLCLCIAAKVPVLNTVLYLILGFTLCAYSTTWGCVCGVKHMKLDWENEIEVIKQGAAVTIYLLPNMFIVMGLCVLVVFLGKVMNPNLISGIMILITSAISVLCYGKVMKLAKRG